MTLLQSSTYRALEFAVIVIGIPVAFYLHNPGPLLLPALWLIALYCNVVCRAMVPEVEREGWRVDAVTRAALKPILKRFAIAGVLMGLATWLLEPESLFSFVRTNPKLWMLVMVLYPILSVVPQEMIFRQFFCRRYASFFPQRSMLVIASGLAFGFAHILFHNWVAPLLCAIGGIFFARTYAARPSLLLVSIEHALYGCFIFTLGLGHYFYHGAIH